MNTRSLSPHSTFFPVKAMQGALFMGGEVHKGARDDGASVDNLSLDGQTALKRSSLSSRQPEKEQEHRVQVGRVTKPTPPSFLTNLFLKKPNKRSEVANFIRQHPDMTFEAMSHMFMRKVMPAELSELGHQTIALRSLDRHGVTGGEEWVGGHTSGVTSSPAVLREMDKFVNPK